MAVEKSDERNVLAAHFLDGNKISVRAVRRLSQSEAETAKINLDAVFTFDRPRQLFSIAEANQRDLLTLMRMSISEMPHGFMQPDTAIANDMYVEMCKGVLNLLSSLKVFLEFSETYLKRKYGGNSTEFKAFKDSQARRFDESFSYRFCYKLRNYTQHCGLPVGELATSTAHRSSTDRTTVLSLVLVRKELLETFDWGKHVVSHLEKLPEKIDLLPHLMEFSKHVNELRDDLTRLDFPSVRGNLKELTCMIEEVSALHPEGTPVIYQLYAGGESFGDLFWLPTKLFLELEKYDR